MGLLSPLPGPAQEAGRDSAAGGSGREASTAAPRPWYEAVALDGFLSATYSYNFNRPASGTNQLRVFDFDDDTFKIDVAELVVQMPATDPGEAGFRADLVAGSSLPRVSASAGLFRDSTGGQDFDLQQAFATYVAPLGRGLRLDAGKFITQHGYEVMEGYDGYNDNVSHSFLFGYAIPFTHTGLRASYAFGARLSGLVMLVNGWDLARDNNRGKSVGAQLVAAPAPALGVTLSGMFGPERPHDGDPRALADLVVSWKPSGRASLGLNFDYGTEKNAVVEGRAARWRGAAAYARLGLTGRLSLVLRGERFDDLDGSRTGAAQKLAEVTVTPEYRATPHLVLRGDLRLDHSDRPVFEKRRDLVQSQPTVAVDTIYLF